MQFRFKMRRFIQILTWGKFKHDILHRTSKFLDIQSLVQQVYFKQKSRNILDLRLRLPARKVSILDSAPDWQVYLRDDLEKN